MRVLIAEDDMVSLRLLESTLRMWGYEPVCCRDGAEAWEVFQQPDAPRLAILDWMMPHISGLELCEGVRREVGADYIYLLMLTAKGQREDVVAGLSAGADDYLIKPFDTRELKVRLRAGRRIVELHNAIRAEENIRRQTEKHHADQLRRSRDQLQMILDGIGDPIFVTDRERNIVLANQAALRQDGHEVRIGERMSCKKILGSRGQCGGEGEQCPVECVHGTGRTAFSTHSHTQEDGTERVIDLLASPIFDEAGSVAMVIESHRDVTRYREAQQALRASQTELEAILASAPVPIMLVDEGLMVRRTNKSTEDTLQIQEGSVRPGMVLGCVLASTGNGCGKHPECSCCSIRRMVLKTLQDNYRCNGDETIIHTLEGQDVVERTLLLYTTPITLSREKLVLICAQDITQRKHYEQALEATANHLRCVNDDLAATQGELSALNSTLEVKVEERTSQVRRLLEQKDTFINQMAHDLKTPLTPLVALLPMLKQEMAPERFEKTVTLLESNVQYMWNLVNRALRLARIHSPSVEFSEERVDLMTETRNILASFETTLDQSDLTLINRISEPVWVRADKLYLRELLDNLLSNAAKYTDPGGEVAVEVHPGDPDVIVAVRDTGVGMTPEQAQRVFDEFYKVDESRHDRSSAGLGLSICKRIVERHGGIIWAESDGPGRGTTLYFSLPRHEQDISADGAGESPGNAIVSS